MNNDSTHVVPEPIKPVRIEHVADDVKLLKSPDVQQQKTLLSGRALKDFGSAVKFEADLATHDGKYLTDGKLDFNLMTDTDIRFIDASQGRVNGPSRITADSMDGIISVTNVLPSGALTYDSVSKVASRSDSTRHIRQIYWPSDINSPGGYTRVGKWDYSVGNFVWSNWVLMSPESINRVIITNPADPALTSMLPNTIYELHCNGCNITLPDALRFRVGTVLGFEQYPNSAALEAADQVNKKGIYAESWSSTVHYETYDPITVGNEAVDFKTVLTSALDPIKEATKETGAQGTWYENAHCGVTYKFENVSIIPFEKNGTTYDRIWSLESDQDSSQVVPEIAELIDKHTDQISDDFVNFNSDAPSAAWDTAVKYISKKADTRGLFKVEISKVAAIPDGFGVAAYLMDESSSGFTYTAVAKPSSNPDSVLDPSVKYYYMDLVLGRMMLAGKAGVVTSWNDVTVDTLYFRTSLINPSTAPATIYSSHDTSGKYGTNVPARFFDGADLYNTSWFNKYTNFVGYIQATADQILTLKLNDSSALKNDKDKVSVRVTFIPDDHDSYLFKDAVVDASGSTEEVMRKASVPGFKVANAESVAAARDEVITSLQNKGLFYGNIRKTSTDLNDYIDAGVYTLVNDPLSLISNLPLMIGGPNGSAGSNLFSTLTVTSSKSYSANKKKPGNDLTIAGDAAGTADSSGFERITQILTSELKVNSTIDLASESYKLLPRMWLRHGIKPSGSSTVTWSSWIHFEPGRTIHTFGYGAEESYTGTGANEINTSKVARLLANGKPSFILKNPTATPIDPTGTLPKVIVNLPDPTPYVNTTFQIEAESNIDVKVRYSVNGDTYSQNYSAASTPDHRLLNIECRNGLWYVVTA